MSAIGAMSAESPKSVMAVQVTSNSGSLIALSRKGLDPRRLPIYGNCLNGSPSATLCQPFASTHQIADRPLGLSIGGIAGLSSVHRT
jgi:hypothetical protein